MAQQPELTEEQIAQLEAEMERVHVDDVLLQTIVSLINLAARKAGLATAPGESGPEPDWDQVRIGIEGARALMPIVEPRHGDQLAPIREGLSRLQMHYVQESGHAAPADPPAGSGAGSASGLATPPAAGGSPVGGDAQRSGRLWVPGQ